MFSEEKVDMLRRVQKEMKRVVVVVVMEMKEVVEEVVREKNDEWMEEVEEIVGMMI